MAFHVFAFVGGDPARLAATHFQGIAKGAMDYPQGFPAQSRNKVEAERIKAKRKLEEDRAAQPPPQWTARKWDEDAFYSYILRVFQEFTRQACELGRAGVWTLDRIRTEADDFLWNLTFMEHYEQGHDRYGQNLPKPIDESNYLLPDIELSLHDSPQWREYEAELIAVAEPALDGTDGNKAISRGARQVDDNATQGIEKRAKSAESFHDLIEAFEKSARVDLSNDTLVSCF